jgi:4-hydroxy-3-methylbut-2-enyl diphosphate reductase
MTPKKLLLAKPRGFCAGVERAIDIVDMALTLYGSPVYVRKEIVHNFHVVESFKTKGVIFVDELDEVPDGAIVVFSAHGISPEVRVKAASKGLKTIDATCPLVTKVHQEAIRFAKEGRTVILIGHERHDEVIGTMGEAPEHIRLVGSVEEADTLKVTDPNQVAIITQTTLSISDTREIIEVLKRRFPKLTMPPKEDICYATQNRQIAVNLLAKEADLVLVLGSANSSNSNRLREVAEDAGARAYLIGDIKEIDGIWLEGVQCVGITAGASAPERLVQGVVAYFKASGVNDIQELEAIKEEVSFALPQELMWDITGRSQVNNYIRKTG